MSTQALALALWLPALAGGEEAASMEPGAPPTALEERLAEEQITERVRFGIIPHKPNYLLAVSYYDEPDGSIDAYDELEVKFQFSFKLALAENLLGRTGTLYFAYTQLSFWQAYNEDLSRPFRENDHEPEIFFAFRNDVDILGFSNRIISVGLVHQSNGRSEPLSRSWNRIYANFIFEKRNLYLGIKPWIRIPEPSEDDDNPDIEDYVGRIELTGLYLWGSSSIGLTARNNLRLEDNRGSLQVDYSFPLYRKLHGYVQGFSGYGESLIDYDRYVNRIGFGIMLTNWL